MKTKNIRLMLLVIFIGVIGSIIVISGNQKNQIKQISLVTDIQDPFSGPALMNNGFVVDIVSTVFKKIGYECHILYLPEEQANQYIDQGKADGKLVRLFEQGHSDLYIPSDPVFKDEINMYSKKGGQYTANTASGSASFRIGVNREDYNSGKLVNLDKYNANIVYLSENEDFIDALLFNRVDLLLQSKATFRAHLKRKHADAMDRLEKIGQSLKSDTLHVLFSKKKEHEKIARLFNNALNDLVKDGTINKITEKYL